MDRDTLAQQMFGKPYAQLTGFEQFRVDDALASAPATKPDGWVEYDAAGNEYRWQGGVRTPTGGTKPSGTSVTVVNPSTTSPANVGSLTLDDIRAQVEASGGKLAPYGGVYRATFPDGMVVDYQPSSKDPKTGAIYFNPGNIVSPKTTAQSSAATSPVDRLRQAQQFAAGQQPTQARSGQPAGPAAPTMQAGDPGTPESNPMLGQAVYGGPRGQEFFGAWLPAGGGSTLTSPNSINSSTSTLAAMGFKLPTDPAQKVAAEATASALMQEFGIGAATELLKKQANTGGLTYAEAQNAYQLEDPPPQYFAQGGSMTIREPSVIQGLLSGKPYGVMGAGAGEQVSNITPLGNASQQAQAGRQESAIARALGGGFEGALPGPRPNLGGVMPTDGSNPGNDASQNSMMGMRGETPSLTDKFGSQPYDEGNPRYTYYDTGGDPMARLRALMAHPGDVEVVRRKVQEGWGRVDDFIDQNSNGIDDRTEEWMWADGRKYKRRTRHEPAPQQSYRPPTPNVYAQGGQVHTNNDPMVLEMMARGIRSRARKVLPKGLI